MAMTSEDTINEITGGDPLSWLADRWEEAVNRYEQDEEFLLRIANDFPDTRNVIGTFLKKQNKIEPRQL